MSKEKSIIVNNKRTGLVGFESEILLPGANKVSEESAKKMKAHPVIKAMIEEGVLDFPELVTEDGISKLSPSEAQTLVESTVDKDLLLSWQKSEKRKTILNTIEKQIGKLAEPATLRDGKKQE